MKFILTTMILMGMLSSTQSTYGQDAANTTFNLLIGTYTKPGKSNGIYVYSFNSETGDFKYKAEVGDIINPSFLVVTQDRKQVYAVSETGNGQGSISAYSFDGQTGNLTYLNSASSGGDGPCYVTVDDNNQYVFVGNYSGGSLSAIPIKTDGSLGHDIQTIKHQGSSVNKSNQNKPHVHATVLSPDNRYLFVPDLGTDKVNIYKVDVANSEPLTPAASAFVSVKPGSGPRHFTFHQNNKHAYVIQEMMGIITVFDYDDGRLSAKQSVTMTSPDFKGKIDAADIHISPDGKFLYGSLRGDINELVIYAIEENGELTYQGRQSTMGLNPRNFGIDPTGNFLLVGNNRSDQITIFKRDHETGLLTPTGKKISVGSPVCIKFVSIDK